MEQAIECMALALLAASSHRARHTDRTSRKGVTRLCRQDKNLKSRKLKLKLKEIFGWGSILMLSTRTKPLLQQASLLRR